MATTQGDASIGMSAAEASYGTITTATKFFEFTSPPTFAWNPTFPQGMGLRVGSRVARADRRSSTPGKQEVTGDFTVEAVSKGMGALLKAAFGSVTTTQRATTGVYQQNHTPATSDLLGSYTIQVGIPPVGGGSTVAYTYAGCVCDQIEFDAPTGDILKIKTTWNGQKVDTATAYAAPSYSTPLEVFHFAEAALVIGGSPTYPTTTALATGGTAVTNIRDFKLTYQNHLDADGFTFGGGGKRGRSPELGVGADMITGSLTAEFTSGTLATAYLNQTDLALILTFTGVTTIGSGSDNPALQIVVPDIVLDGSLPNANDGGVITHTLNFTGLDNLTNPPITVVYASLDTAP